MNGTAKVGEHTTDNLDQSIEDFKTALRFLPEGKYKLKACDKPNVYNSALETTFTKGATSSQQPTMQGLSTNAYGIPDHVYAKIQQETEQRVLMQQMHGEFIAFMKEWPKYKDMIDKIDAYLKEDLDGDGTPDIFQTARNAAETVQKVGEIKKVFSGSSVFGD